MVSGPAGVVVSNPVVVVVSEPVVVVISGTLVVCISVVVAVGTVVVVAFSSTEGSSSCGAWGLFVWAHVLPFLFLIAIDSV